MYHTKHTGRNGYSFFQPSMNTQAQTQLQLMNDLWLARERKDCALFTAKIPGTVRTGRGL
ncbi:hypothetical protein [Cronobacter sakazakii]|uniref:hypothetical protein n=1 Tax=Cronobacter sakazakii TaxID=28141 RepID=UPI003518219F